jgi:hypothetical protein
MDSLTDAQEKLILATSRTPPHDGSSCKILIFFAHICPPSIEKLPPEKPVTHNTTITIVHTWQPPLRVEMKAKTQEKVMKMGYRASRYLSREHAMHFVGLETGIYSTRGWFSRLRLIRVLSRTMYLWGSRWRRRRKQKWWRWGTGRLGRYQGSTQCTLLGLKRAYIRLEADFLLGVFLTLLF